jgi:hypothetical protein
MLTEADHVRRSLMLVTNIGPSGREQWASYLARMLDRALMLNERERATLTPAALKWIDLNRARRDSGQPLLDYDDPLLSSVEQQQPTQPTPQPKAKALKRVRLS